MIEVFKTNVPDEVSAHHLLGLIHGSFHGYRANFDLQDCDRILRIHNPHGDIDAEGVINLLTENSFDAAILPDVTVNKTIHPQEAFNLN